MNRLEVSNFSLKDTIECGQTFCWTREGEGYVCTDVGQVVYVEQQGNVLMYETSSHDVDISRMFRLHDPIDTIQQSIAKDELIQRSVEYAPGLRVIADPFFPCLITFLCSIQKNIPAIRRSVQKIRERWGPAYEFRGRTYYGMPEPSTLARLKPDELRQVGIGWRAEFISRTARDVANGDVDERYLRGTSYEEAHSVLKGLHGVGDKVADCVSLFSLGHLEAFPIDVWIERVIRQHYDFFTDAGKSYARKSQAARSYFGKYAGYAQEYLYYYSKNTFETRSSVS